MAYVLPPTDEVAEAIVNLQDAIAEAMEAVESIVTVQIVYDNGKIVQITRDEEMCDVNEPLIQAAGEC